MTRTLHPALIIFLALIWLAGVWMMVYGLVTAHQPGNAWQYPACAVGLVWQIGVAWWVLREARR